MLKNCDSEVGYKTNYSSAWLTRSPSLALRIGEYMYICLIVVIAIDFTFLSDTAKKNKETLLFARISNIYLVQIEKYSRDYFTYSPYRRPSVSCLSVGPFVRPSINTQVSSIFLFRPLTRLGESWKCFFVTAPQRL